MNEGFDPGVTAKYECDQVDRRLTTSFRSFL